MAGLERQISGIRRVGVEGGEVRLRREWKGRDGRRGDEER